MRICARLRNALAGLAVLIPASTAWCFPNPKEFLDDFTHYALIANVDLAAANAQALMDSGVANADLAMLLDDSPDALKRFDDAVARAHMIPELEPVAAELAKRVEMGRLDLARDPKRIDQSVGMLTGTQRQKMLARERLVAAQEYAVPALLKQITEGRDEQLKLACQDMLVRVGGPAVAPLCEALLNLTGVSQRVVCDILGTIRHPSAAPYLRELAMDEQAEGPAREAAARAFKSVGAVEAPLSNLYSDLARRYFDAHESLVTFPTEPTNNVWSYSNITGLSPMPVPTAIFCEVMAMRTSAKALKIDQGNLIALDLFVASNLKRENDLPEGAADPVYGENKYTPEFYATVFGTQTCLNVLGMAIDKLDTPLVRDAIAALSKTTGGANLFTRGQGRQPLLEALTYPDRRVQNEAALTLGRALPQQSFVGDTNVVPILGSSVRMGNKSLAMVVAYDDENRKATVTALEQLGFAIVGAGPSVAALQPDIAKAGGIDLIAVRMNDNDETMQALASLRSIPKTSAAPVVVLSSAVDLPALQREYRDDPRVSAIRPSADPQQFSAAVEGVMLSASGGRISEAEAEEYAIRALAALRDIAISRITTYNIADAESALIDALDSRTGGTRMLVADIVALINSDTAQRKLFDVALAATDEEQIELLRRTADSVRLCGDHAETRHVEALVQLIAQAGGPTAEAAAAVHGALNLSASDAVNLIPQP